MPDAARSSDALIVPDVAVSALVQAFLADYDEEVRDQLAHEHYVRAIAAPVVAAELRSWTAAAFLPITNTDQNDYEKGVNAGIRIAVDRLRRRADQLDS